jgi:sugar lactone lactonase YvrE
MASRKARLMVGFGCFVLVVVVFFIVRWPAREYRSWTPPPHPAWTGVLAPNTLLQKADMLGGPEMIEPEDIAVDAKGWIYGPCKDGKIRRVDASGKRVEVFADTGGRPLGIMFDAKGDLIVADALKGLLRVSPKGKVSVLADSYKGKRMRFVDDLDIASDGSIYFSDVSTKYTFDFDTRPELMARVPTGRLFRYVPKTKALTLVLDKLHFANGVALSHKEDYVLIAETSDYSVRRLWLKGPKAGKSDVFASNLPGYPDNINRSSQGGFWLALTSKRLSHVDGFFHSRGWLKKLIMSLPKALMPKPVKSSLVVHLDANGKVTHNLQDPNGSVIPNTTSATEHKGKLYLGHIYHKWPGIGRYTLGTGVAVTGRKKK